MKKVITRFTMITSLMIAMLVAFSGTILSQAPPPNLSLIPVVLISISLDGVAKPVNSPAGNPLPAPEFLVPRTGTKTFNLNTKDGSIDTTFSHSVSSGVPASAFTLLQAVVPAPNAVGKLQFNGCKTCPSSFTVTVTARSGGVGQRSSTGTFKVTLTVSTAKPVFTGISEVGGPEIESTFEVRFTPGTFELADSEVIGVYDGGALKYKLIPESTSNIAGGAARVKIPRLKANRNVSVFLRNPFGATTTRNVTLGEEVTEAGGPQFEPVNASHTLGNGVYNDSYSVKHTNSGIIQFSGTDVITISPPNSGTTPCNARDFIYTGSRASWLDPKTDNPVTGHGTVSVTGNPSVNSLLRAPNNKVTLSYTLPALHPDRFYQVLFEGVEIIGVCSDRVVQ